MNVDAERGEKNTSQRWMSNGVWRKAVQESDPNAQAVQPFGGALGESGSTQHLASHWANCGLHHCFHCEQSLLSLDRLQEGHSKRFAGQSQHLIADKPDRLRRCSCALRWAERRRHVQPTGDPDRAAGIMYRVWPGNAPGPPHGTLEALLQTQTSGKLGTATRPRVR